MTIARFGQQVQLEVYGADGKSVLITDGLRVDFDIVNIPGFSRATFSIWNLSDLQIGQIKNGERYCRLTATLHDNTPMILADDFYVSNSYEEKKLPDSVTRLYTYSKVRKDFLEKTVSVSIKNPSLRNTMKHIVQVTGFEGKIIYKNFPESCLAYTPPRRLKDRTGSVQGLMEMMGKQCRFKFYTIGKDLVLQYQPAAENLRQSSLYTATPDVVLDAQNMSANPRIGPATLEVTSDLDAYITPTAILDVSKLITASVDADDVTLQLAEDYVQDSIAGFTKYQALTVTHKGSNYTKKWDTQVTATSPDKGTSMPTIGWMKSG